MAFDGQLQPPDFPIVLSDGRPTTAFALFLRALKKHLSPDIDPNPPPVLQTDFISGVILFPANQDYRIVEELPYDATITKFTAKTSSGTATAALSSNGVAVTDGSLNVSSVQSSTVPSALNVCASPNDLTLTISGSASPNTMSFTIEFTREIG